MMVFWQVVHGEPLPSKYTDHLELPSYVFIAVGIFLSLRRFKVKRPIWQHSKDDVTYVVEHIKRNIFHSMPVAFFRAHPLFGYTCLLGGTTLVLNTLWRRFLPSTNNENYITLFLPPLIARRSKNINIKKAARIVIMIWFACIALLIYYDFRDMLIQEDTNVKVSVQKASTKRVNSSSKVNVTGVPPTPTIDVNKTIDCKINERCGGKSVKLTIAQCMDTTCCQLGDTWFFSPHIETCKKAQVQYNAKVIEQMQIQSSIQPTKPLTTIVIPTLPPIHTLAPLPTLPPIPTYSHLVPTLPPINSYSSGTTPIDMGHLYSECVKIAYQRYNDYVNKMGAIGWAESSFTVQAGVEKEQALETCSRLYGPQ